MAPGKKPLPPARCDDCREQAAQCEPCRELTEKRTRTREAARAWRAAHPGYNALHSKLYQQRHPEKVKLAHSRWVKANPEKRRALEASWRERNPERVADNHKRAMAKYREANQEQINARERAVYIDRIYGVTRDERDAMFAAQGNLCGICARPDPGMFMRGGVRAWCFDHSHDFTMKDRQGHRGILCHPCNVRLGFAEKYRLPLSQQEASYLARWRKRAGLPEDLTLRRTIGE